MDPLPQNRRSLLETARKLLTEPPRNAGRTDLHADDSPPRLTLHALEKIRMSRSRERILANIDEMYREAFSRAQASEDEGQMATLDFAYRREQLYFEILLDIRDAIERR
jgi:hypothetical protein